MIDLQRISSISSFILLVFSTTFIRGIPVMMNSTEEIAEMLILNLDELKDSNLTQLIDLYKELQSNNSSLFSPFSRELIMPRQDGDDGDSDSAVTGAASAVANAGGVAGVAGATLPNYGQAFANSVLDVIGSSLTGNIEGIITGSLRIFRNPGAQDMVQGAFTSVSNTFSKTVASGLELIGITSTANPIAKSVTVSPEDLVVVVSDIGLNQSSTRFSHGPTIVNTLPGQQVYLVVSPNGQNSQAQLAQFGSQAYVPVDSQILPVSIPQGNPAQQNQQFQQEPKQYPPQQFIPQQYKPALQEIPTPTVTAFPASNRENNKKEDEDEEEEEEEDNDL